MELLYLLELPSDLWELMELMVVAISLEFTTSPKAQVTYGTYPTYSTYGLCPQVQQL